MKKIVLPGVALIAVCYAFGRFSYGLFMPEISEALRLSESASGAINSATYIAYCLALLTAPLIINHKGHHYVIQLAGISATLGLIGIGLAHDTWLLAVGVFLAGLSTGWASPALGNAVSAELSPNLHARGNSWINTGTSFGIIVSGPLYLLCTDYWRLSYILFALIGITVLLWNRHAIPATKTLPCTKSIWSCMRPTRPGSALLMACLLTGASSAIYWTFARNFLTDEKGASDSEAVLFWIVMGITGILGGCAGRIIERIELGWSYRIGILLLSISLGVILLPSMTASLVSAILFGSTYIFLSSIFIVWATRLFQPNVSIGISLAFLALGVGQFLGSFMAGYTIEVFSSTTAFMAFAFLGLLGLFLRVNPA
ncbi:MFS transporter [Paenibacillus silvae]|uniref:MFS transporter n=1 Tax=Paenibacillus silvae TaxID=1325358 RepID=UPI0011A2BDF2|nr:MULTISPECIES: MFS transporter [Paenibacillus]MCK6074556.1 MFS transporter [Paenibacillus silvae]MCK6147968.1 MFS transporter [Paenibacillus silvae]MCK6266266.1 MFS transporter [Paenibacillus silvae]